MVNRIRGEITARLDERDWTLCLTLGALAELEAAYAEADLLALAERFDDGRLASRDLIRIIGAGLRGAGHDVADDDVARMPSPTGAAGYVDVVRRLLQATFTMPADDAG